MAAPTPPPPPTGTSVTASDYISAQLALEREARDLMPYSFSTCTYPLGPLRQPVFACKTHFNPTTDPTSQPFALCYSCSISCHGDCELVELFAKRNIVCDCGTSRTPGNAPCKLRPNGGRGDVPAKGNRYCHNYEGRFCDCDRDYDVAKETGTMYQCLVGEACNEDWFHDACIVGEKREEKADGEGVDETAEVDVKKEEKEEKEEDTDGDIKMEATDDTPTVDNTVKLEPSDSADTAEPQDTTTNNNDTAADDDDALSTASSEDYRPPGFPELDSFEAFICWKCVDKYPYLRNYAGKPGFLPAVIKKDAIPKQSSSSPPPPSLEDVKLDTDTNTTAIKVEPEQSPPATTTSSPPQSSEPNPKKRKASLDPTDETSKRPLTTPSSTTTSTCTLPPPSATIPPTTPLSLFLTHPPHHLPTPICPCPLHHPPPPSILTNPHPEPTYSPPLSRSASPTSTSSNASIHDLGERALLTHLPREQAIDGVNAYRRLKEKVTEFLRPFAEGGREVGEEDVREYFRRLKEGGVGGLGGGVDEGNGKGGGGGDGRREQSGY